MVELIDVFVKLDKLAIVSGMGWIEISATCMHFQYTLSTSEKKAPYIPLVENRMFFIILLALCEYFRNCNFPDYWE